MKSMASSSFAGPFITYKNCSRKGSGCHFCETLISRKQGSRFQAMLGFSISMIKNQLVFICKCKGTAKSYKAI